MRRGRSLLLALAAAGLLVAAGLTILLLPAGPVEDLEREQFAQEEVARERARDFLDDYTTPEGRVVRWDQGGDTVSEGQAYGMMLAVAAGDEARFERIWAWTRRELPGPDGLLAWLWADGQVVDAMAATDADLEAAWALVLAADRFDRAEWRHDAVRLAGAVLEHATARVDGRLVLTAGQWATDEPVVVNPSYLVPLVFDDLGVVSGDPRWDELGESSRHLLAELTAGGRQLPPDWAHLNRGAGPRPVGSPQGDGQPRYGLDAARIPVRLATSCAPEDQALAARLWERLRAVEDAGARIEYQLTGEAVSAHHNPLGLVGAAAAASAGGAHARAEELLEEADRLAGARPSYYGNAWAALGRVLLRTDLLGGCGAPG